MSDASQVSAAKIKLPQPRRSDVVRPGLDAALHAALREHPLVLLQAPAGFGKTVALARQLDRLPPQAVAAWVHAEPGDDLERLLSAVLAALDAWDLPWRVAPEALAAMAAQPGSQRRSVAVLAEALAQSDAVQGLLVIDDLHSVADPRALDFLDELVDALPPRWTLAVTSRTEPPLSLPRRRLHGQLAEFRRAELAFSPSEVRALLAAHGVPAADEDAARLAQYTQGWAAGLILTMSALRPGMPMPLRGRRHLFDYLAQEVLAAMPPAQRRFLQQCSLLRDLDAERCRQLTGDAHSVRWLQALERSDLFVTVLDDEPLTLRLHDLFRDFLQEQLTLHEPDLPALLQRAARCESELPRRVELLLRAGRQDEAVQALFEVARPMIRDGAAAQVLRTVEQFPAALQAQSPQLLHVKALCAMLRYDWDVVHQAEAQASAGFAQQGEATLAVQAQVLDAFSLIFHAHVAQARQVWSRAFRPSGLDEETALLCDMHAFYECAQDGPNADAVRHLADAARRFPRVATGGDWVVFWNTLYIYTGRAGVRPALETFASLLAEAGEEMSMLRTSALELRAWLTLFRGEVEAVAPLAAELERDMEWLGQPAGLRSATSLLQCYVTVLRGGDLATVQRHMAPIFARFRGRPEAPGHALYLAHLGSFAALLGDWPQARSSLQALQAAPKGDWVYLLLAEALLQAMLLLQEGRAAEAAALLDPLADRAWGCEWWGLNGRLRGVLAQAWHRAGEPARAAAGLSPALRQALLSGEPLGLLLCGSGALAELAGAEWQGTLPADERALLQRLSARAAALRGLPDEGGNALDEAEDAEEAEQGEQVDDTRAAPTPPVRRGADELTPRELEVLTLLARGDSNKVIARELALSPHTIKRHVASILDKTGQSSRVGAAAWLARQSPSPPASR